MDERANNTRWVYIMNYYSARKRTEVPIPATSGWTLQSERSQSQMTTYYMIPVIRKSTIAQFVKTESRLAVTWGKGGWKDGEMIKMF